MQASFYILFPLLLRALRPTAPGFRTRLTITAVSFTLISIVYRTIAIVLLDIGVPISMFATWDRGLSGGHSPAALRSAWGFSRFVWCSLFARCSDLGAGLFVYLWVSHPQTIPKARKRARLYEAVTGVTALLALVSMTVRQIPHATEPDPSIPLATRTASIVAMLSVISPTCVACFMVYVIVRPDALSRALACALSGKIAQRLADTSYGSYLMHMHVTFLMSKLLPVVHWFGMPPHVSAVLLFPLAVYILSYLVAEVYGRVVDYLVRGIKLIMASAAPKAKTI